MDGGDLMFGDSKKLIKEIVEVTMTEDYIRSFVGAPSKEEEELCTCGEELESCPDAYVHMTSGV